MSENSRPEAFAEAARSGLTAANAATLATCTLVGGTLSVFADVAPPDWGHAMGVMALASWVFSIALALYLAGRSTRSQEAQGLLLTVVEGAKLARAKPGIAAMVVLMTAGAAFTVWSRMHKDQGSVLLSLVAAHQRVAVATEITADRTAAIQTDTRAILSTVTQRSPAAALADLGYGTSDVEACRAIGTGAIQALQLMQKIASFQACANRLSTATCAALVARGPSAQPMRSAPPR